MELAQELYAMRSVAAEARNAAEFMTYEQDRKRLRELAGELEKRASELEAHETAANIP